MNKTYKSTEYYLWFQAAGVNFLSTELFARDYCLLADIVITTKDGVYKQYLRTSVLPEARGLYELFYKDIETVEACCDTFEHAAQYLRDYKQELGGKDIGLADFNQIVEYVGVANREYGKFDHIYTDYLFENEEHYAAIIALVMEKKNTLREVINEIFFNDDSIVNLMIQKISHQYGLEQDEVAYSSIENIRSLLSGYEFKKIGPNKDYVFIKKGDTFQMYFGDEATVFIDSFEVADTEVSKQTSLKGASVSKKGVYKGKVKKLFVDYTKMSESIAAFSSFEEGSILVTDSTVPEMLPVMSKSIAIITDIGGMLSHAAITSRELGIPCVVGTKDATKVLNDGDEVEVNADTGVVTIL